MSRRDRKKQQEEDEGDSLGAVGKVTVGLAAAAAGAAIGYFGAKLLSGWLTEEAKASSNDKEKEEKCKSDFEYSSDKYKRQQANENSSSATISKFDAITQPVETASLSLYEQLLVYYYEYVDIPLSDATAVKQVVDKVLLSVNHYIHSPKNFKSSSLKIGELVVFGSATEGLQVIHPENFDVMIPIMFKAPCAIEKASATGTQEPGCSFIRLEQNSQYQEQEALCDEHSHVVIPKLTEYLQDAVQKAVEGCDEVQCNVLVSSSQRSVSVGLSSHENGNVRRPVTINFIPFIIVNNRLFLPISDLQIAPDMTDTMWCESFIRQEKWSLDRFGAPVSGHMMALKILKAIRLNHREQFGAVSSYHLKTLLFHALEDLPDSCDWVPEAVGERLIDLLTQLTEALVGRSLPHFFEQNVNCFHHVPVDTCASLAKFIEKKLAHNDISSLIKKEY